MGLKYRGGALLEKFALALSQLGIDADKDWLDSGMTNIAHLTAGVQRGDMIYHNGSILTKLAPGRIGDSLTTLGPGRPPYWTPARPRHPTAGILPASDITTDEAEINGIVLYDNGATCEYRFRYRKVGAPGYDYTAWDGHHLSGDYFHERIAGLDPSSDYEFQCQIQNIAGEGLWTDHEYFTTLP